MAFDKDYYLDEFDGVVRFYRQAHKEYLNKGRRDFSAPEDESIMELFQDFHNDEDFEMCKCMSDAWLIYLEWHYDDTITEWSTTDSGKVSFMALMEEAGHDIDWMKDEEDDEDELGF